MATRAIEEPRSKSVLLDVRHRITVEEYHQMIESGAFGTEPRVELLEGVIVRRMVSSPSHSLSCDLIPCVLRDQRPTGYFISRRCPLTVHDRDSEPEPDAMVLRGSPRDYAGRGRTSADT